MSGKMFYINNTRLVNKLKNDGDLFLLNTEHSLPVFTTKNKKEIYIKFIVSARDGSFPLRPLDFLIIDAVYTICREYENEIGSVFSLKDLDRVLLGKTDFSQDHFLSKKRRDLLKEHLENIMNTYITINFEAEAIARRKTEHKSITISDEPLLPIEKQGRKYCILNIPPFYKYSSLNEQVIPVPENLFYCREANLVNNEKNILLRYYLIHQLEIMRTSSKKYNITRIPFLKNPTAISSDTGILAQVSPKRYFYEFDENCYIKYKCNIRNDLNKSSTQQYILNVEKSVIDILEFYKKEKYLKNYDISRTIRRKDKAGLPQAITNVEFFAKYDDTSAEPEGQTDEDVATSIEK
ncbi:MAG: hypothetical protein IKC07_02515 [Clostridia bacterium]|nr:hypothetical protein [Clostridia bacterium]